MRLSISQKCRYSAESKQQRLWVPATIQANISYALSQFWKGPPTTIEACRYTWVLQCSSCFSAHRFHRTCSRVLCNKFLHLHYSQGNLSCNHPVSHHLAVWKKSPDFYPYLKYKTPKQTTLIINSYLYRKASPFWPILKKRGGTQKLEGFSQLLRRSYNICVQFGRTAKNLDL